MQHGLELTKLIEERGEEPTTAGFGTLPPLRQGLRSEGFTLFRFSDGTEVIETNAGLVTDDGADEWNSLRHMIEE
jgi:hypothetical protein